MLKYGEKVEALEEIRVTNPKNGNIYKVFPCPVCGSKDLNLHTNDDFVQCNSCRVSGPVFNDSSDEAVAAWNDLRRS